MSTPRDFDRIASTWLAEGPSELADRVLEAALEEVHLTHQRRRVRAPWRDIDLSRFVAAAAAVILVVAGGVLVLGNGFSGSGTSPATSPSATPTPTSAPTSAPTSPSTIVNRSAEAGYSFVVPAGWNTRSQGNLVFLSPPLPLNAGLLVEGGLVPGSDAGEYSIDAGANASGSNTIRGIGVDGLLESLNGEFRRTMNSEPTGTRTTQIDGESGWIVEHLTTGPDVLIIDAVVIHGDRALNVSLGAPPDSAAALREAFDVLLASITWTD